LEPCQLPFLWAANHCHITPPILAKDGDSCMTSHTREQVMGTGTAIQPTFRETRPRTLPAATALADLPPDYPSLEIQAPKYMRLASPASTGVALSALVLFLYASISPTHAFLFPPRPSFLPSSLPSARCARGTPPPSSFSPLSPLPFGSHLLHGSRENDKAARREQQSKRQLRVGRLLQSTVADVIRKVLYTREGGREDGKKNAFEGIYISAEITSLRKADCQEDVLRAFKRS